MPRKLHDAWGGFLPVRKNGIIFAAKCQICGRLLKKRDKCTLITHRYVFFFFFISMNLLLFRKYFVSEY